VPEGRGSGSSNGSSSNSNSSSFSGGNGGLVAGADELLGDLAKRRQ
jgi:hypothetical protein